MKIKNICKRGLLLIIVFMIVLFSIPFSLSQDGLKVDKEEVIQQLKKNPFVSASMIEQFERTINILKDDYGDVMVAVEPDDLVIVIEGSDINGVEKTFVSFLEKQFPFINKIDRISDKTISMNEVRNTNKTVILLGGPSQNSVAEQLFREGLLQEKEHPSESALAIYEGKNQAGSAILVLSDRRGFENIGREGPNRSPLSRYMAPEAVVVTASFLSILLAALWAKLGGAIRVLFARLLTGKRKKTINIHHKAKDFGIGNLRIKYRELFAILIAALVYTTAVTISVTGLGYSILDVLKISIIGGLLFFGIREFGRIILCYFKGLHTEYTIWLPGAILSLGTGFLGNTLNTPGVVIEHKDKEVKFGQYAFVKYIMVLGTTILGAALFIANILSPSKGIQMFAVIASTYAVAEIMPFKPMPGNDIMKWKPVLFALTFIMILCIYVLFNFII